MLEEAMSDLRAVRVNGYPSTANSKIYLWSDMFGNCYYLFFLFLFLTVLIFMIDPNHNAVDNYYLVDTTIAGSWLALPSDTIIMNWNLGNLATSMTFFAETLNLNQIIAGYYDSGIYV